MEALWKPASAAYVALAGPGRPSSPPHSRAYKHYPRPANTGRQPATTNPTPTQPRAAKPARARARSRDNNRKSSRHAASARASQPPPSTTAANWPTTNPNTDRQRLLQDPG